MGKGSGRRPSAVSEAELEKAWNSIFASHPNEGQFDKEDDYGNELPENKRPKPNDPNLFVDETGDA